MNAFPLKNSWPAIVGLAVVSFFLPKAVLVPGALALSLVILIYLVTQWPRSFGVGAAEGHRIKTTKPIAFASIVSGLSFFVWKELFTFQSVFREHVSWGAIFLWMVDTWLFVFILMAQKAEDAAPTARTSDTDPPPPPKPPFLPKWN